MPWSLFLTFLFISSFEVSAQSLKCGKKFELISNNCIIHNTDNKFKQDLAFTVSQDTTGLIDKTYFYKTEFGNLGKFKIKSVISNKDECTIYLDATTYIDGTSYTPSLILNIKNEYNIWNSDSIGLDRRGNNDLILKRENGKCIFATNRAEMMYYGKLVDESLKTGRELLYYGSLFLIGLAVFLVANSIFSDEQKFKAQETLEEVEETTKNEPSPDFILKYSRPFFKRYFSPIVQGMKTKKKFREKYKRPLASSGLTRELTPEDFFAFKLFLIIGFPIVFIGLRAFLETDWPMSAIPALSVFGFFYPDIWIKGKIDIRKKDIIQNMPFIVDMLALSVEAGLDFVAAMTKVIEKAPPSALSQEFEIFLRETRIGASRAEGLRQMAWRCDTIQISSFCATLIAADSVGANIAPILKTLSAEMRQKRSSEAEKQGATAATKILFPMMFLILPSVAIIIAAPIVLDLIA